MPSKIIILKRMRVGAGWAEPGSEMPPERWEAMRHPVQHAYLNGNYVKEVYTDDPPKREPSPPPPHEPAAKRAFTHDEDCKCIGCRNKRKRAAQTA